MELLFFNFLKSLRPFDNSGQKIDFWETYFSMYIKTYHVLHRLHGKIQQQS
jgi:hypothetical protein